MKIEYTTISKGKKVMKFVLTALNAKYIHTSLSVRCLYANVKDICDATIKEYTINDTIGDICSDILSGNPDCVAFSCYIWNIEMVLKVSSVIKKANPDITIVLGGYEAMYESEKLMQDNPQIDVIIRGEGEITLREYIKSGLINVAGLTYRQNGNIISTPNRTELCELDSLPFVYDDSIDEYKNRIIYYESSRGCPYRCTYCISGDNSKVRFLSVDRVKRELDFFIEHKVPLVKFVDRTFNANPKRAKEILRHIADRGADTVFHMELSGDIIDDEMIEIVSKVKKGTLRFEIGVQTTNPDTMKAIERDISFSKLSDAVKKLMELDTAHIHLDLIAGLPEEDIASFKKSFEDVLSLKPHVLQLGFLKLLKGSKIRTQEENYNYKYSPYAPYEVISNDFVSYEDLLAIKCVEEALEKYYNSGSFAHTMKYLFGKEKSMFDLFLKVGKYIKESFVVGYAFSRQQLFDVLYEAVNSSDILFMEELKRDYLMHFRVGKRPYWFDEEDKALIGRVYDMFRDEELKKEHFPQYYDIPAKEIMKHIHPERFSDGIYIFDYKNNSVQKIDRFCLQ